MMKIASREYVHVVLLTDKSALSDRTEPPVGCSECVRQSAYLLRPCMHTCCKACGKNVNNGDKCPLCRLVVDKKVLLYG